MPIGERALFWVQLYVGIVRPLFVSDQDPDLLFLSSVGTPICADWLCRKVRAYLRQAGIDKRGSCHLLRHSVATLMLEGGADIRYVAEMLGHARLETTQRYTRVSIERLRTVHARCHPASGLDVAMASELCSMLPEGASGLRAFSWPKASLIVDELAATTTPVSQRRLGSHDALLGVPSASTTVTPCTRDACEGPCVDQRGYVPAESSFLFQRQSENSSSE